MVEHVYGGILESPSLVPSVIRDPYVILGLALIGFFVIFLISKMPQSKDESGMPSIKDIFLVLLKNNKYVLGVLAQILYVGAQIMCWTYIYHYVKGMLFNGTFEILNINIFGFELEKDAFYYQIIAILLFITGRAIGTYLLRFVSSGKLLMYFAILALISTGIAMQVEGMIGLYGLVAISFFMSLMFPTIYGIALDDLTEEQSKVGSAGLIMAIVGGALMPVLQGMIIDIGGTEVADTQIMGVSEVNFSFILPLICFIYVAWYGLTVYKKYEATSNVSLN